MLRLLRVLSMLCVCTLAVCQTKIDLPTQTKGILPQALGGTGCGGNGVNGQVLISDGNGHLCPGDPIVSLNFVPLLSVASATSQQVSLPVRVSNFGASGTLYVRFASISGSGTSCTVQLINYDSMGDSLPNGSPISVTPANGTTSNNVVSSAGLLTAAQLSATYSCSGYPTGGTISVEFVPSVPVAGAFSFAPPTGAGATQTQGTAGNGSSTVGNPVWVCGTNGGKCTAIATDSAGNTVIVGAGTAGTPAGGVVSIQGVVGGQAVAVSGTVTANAGSGTFNVNCTSGCSAGFVDNSAFTASTTTFGNVGGVFNDGLSALSSGNAAVTRMTTNRALHINLRNNAGAEIGTSATPIRTDPTGTTTQPVSGQVTVIPTPNASTNLAQVGGWPVLTGKGVSGVGVPRVTISNDSSVQSTQSGNWVMQPGNIPNIAPWLFTLNGPSATNNVPVNVFAPGHLRVTQDPNTLFFEDFGGTPDLINKWKLAFSGTGTSPVWTLDLGSATLNPGTTANSTSLLQSIPVFSPQEPGFIYFTYRNNFEFPISSTAYRFWGLGTTPAVQTSSNPIVDGCGWDIPAGQSSMFAVCYQGTNGTTGARVVIQDLSAATGNGKQPTNNGVHKYINWFSGAIAYWAIDTYENIVASYVTGANGPNVNTLPLTAIAVQTGAVPGTFGVNAVAVGDTSRNEARICDQLNYWLCATVKGPGVPASPADTSLVATISPSQPPIPVTVSNLPQIQKVQVTNSALQPSSVQIVGQPAVSQGSPGLGTSGWATVPGNTGPVQVAWDSTTTTGTTAIIQTANYPTVVLAMDTGNATSGTIQFETNTQGVQWNVIQGVQIGVNQGGTGGTVGSSLTVGAFAHVTYVFSTAGVKQFRIRLSGAIGGTGTAILSLLGSGSSNPMSTLANVSGKDTDPISPSSVVVGYRNNDNTIRAMSGDGAGNVNVNVAPGVDSLTGNITTNWNNATAVNTAVNSSGNPIPTCGATAITVGIIQSGGLASGTIIFEYRALAGSAFLPATGVNITSGILQPSVFAFGGSATVTSILFSISGCMSDFQVRLTSAILDSGSVQIGLKLQGMGFPPGHQNIYALGGQPTAVSPTPNGAAGLVTGGIGADGQGHPVAVNAQGMQVVEERNLNNFGQVSKNVTVTNSPLNPAFVAVTGTPPVVGTLAHNTAAPVANQVDVMPALANNASPTLTEGTSVKASMDLKGNWRTSIFGTGTSNAAGVNSANGAAQSANLALDVMSFNHVWDGSQWQALVYKKANTQATSSDLSTVVQVSPNQAPIPVTISSFPSALPLQPCNAVRLTNCQHF